MRFRRTVHGAAVAALATAVVVPAANSAGAASSASITVTITTPEGVAANVEIDGGRHAVVAKQANGTSRTATVVVPAGGYTITPNTAQYHGQSYQGQATPASVNVASGQNRAVSVTYSGESTSASHLHLTDLTGTSVSLAWDAPANGAFALRRTVGKTPASTPRDGTRVQTIQNAATDSGLTPGTSYAYALFTMVRGSWVGPLTRVVGTTPPDGSTEAAYVTAPNTLLADAADIAGETTTGDGVIVTFVPGFHLPVLGAAVVLPISDTLVGGYLGKVVAISSDGVSVLLTGASMTDAFDYYSLDIPDFSALDAASSNGASTFTPALAHAKAHTAPASHRARVRTARAHHVRAVHKAKAHRTHRAPRRHLTHRTRAPRRTNPTPFTPAIGSLQDCLGGSADYSVSFDPQVSLDGSFDGHINHGWFGIPDGASMDASLGVTVGGAVGVKTAGEFKCEFAPEPYMQTITAEPVPMSIYFEPTAAFTIGGAMEISNVGATASTGVNFSADIGLTGVDFDADPYHNATVLTPTIKTNGEIGASIGGQFIFGPGAGTSGAGVIAGVSGQFNPLEAGFGPVFVQTDDRFNSCLKASLGGSADLALTAKAWVGDWDVSESFDLLSGEWDYGTWYTPENCEDGSEPPTDPGDSVLGPGVTKVDDSTQGSPSQIGYVDGFVPGENTWLLSTGLVANAVGSPWFFASTGMGQPGDSTLSSYSGHPTYDAAGYEVTLIPSGSTLHVKYVFASEEYPEYVGSAYNDVMEILVNGQNCATVPGTSTPVSINTVNQYSNSSYYVDNSTGAAGYNTTYDGLTVPLTCNAAVTPGQPVTVKIAVADASDSIYDSGIALLDDGIWSS